MCLAIKTLIKVLNLSNDVLGEGLSTLNRRSVDEIFIKTASAFPPLEVLDNYKTIFLGGEEEMKENFGAVYYMFYSLMT